MIEISTDAKAEIKEAIGQAYPIDASGRIGYI